MFIPETGETCSFPDLPNDRKYHSINTLDNNTVVICGGGDTMCIQLTPTSASGVWTKYSTGAGSIYGFGNLRSDWDNHLGWVSSAGLMLLGRYGAERVPYSSGYAGIESRYQPGVRYLPE